MKIENAQIDYISFAKEVFDHLPDIPEHDMLLRSAPFAWKNENVSANERVFIDIKNKNTDREISIDMAGYFTSYKRNEKDLNEIIACISSYIDVCLQSDMKIAKELGKLPEIEEEFER